MDFIKEKCNKYIQFKIKQQMPFSSPTSGLGIMLNAFNKTHTTTIIHGDWQEVCVCVCVCVCVRARARQNMRTPRVCVGQLMDRCSSLKHQKPQLIVKKITIK